MVDCRLESVVLHVVIVARLKDRLWIFGGNAIVNALTMSFLFLYQICTFLHFLYKRDRQRVDDRVSLAFDDKISDHASFDPLTSFR